MFKDKQQLQGLIYMLICSILWSIAGIIIKLIPWNALVIAGWRSLFAALCVLIYMRIAKLRFSVNRGSIISALALGTAMVTFIYANKLTTAANAIVLQFTSPIFILLLSWIIYRQRFSKADLIAVGVVTLGIALFFFDQLAPGNLLGNLIAIFAGLMIAVMFVNSARMDNHSRMSGILMGHLLAALIGVPAIFFYDTPLTAPAIAGILALGIFQIGIPYILFGLAVQKCSPLVCSLISAVEPLLNPVWVFLFVGELPGPFALVGGIIVIATITVWCFLRDKKVDAIKQAADDYSD